MVMVSCYDCSSGLCWLIIVEQWVRVIIYVCVQYIGVVGMWMYVGLYLLISMIIIGIGVSVGYMSGCSI